jgi:DNA-directed RNA polymerase subunit RPC12/RpoP
MRVPQKRVVVLKKGLVFGFLLLITGFFLWRLVAGGFSNPVTDVAATVAKENFAWFTCPSCSMLFMAEETTRKGQCPYCGSTMMLGIEAKRIIGTSVDESQFSSFLSPACNKLFFAYQTNEVGRCPYCGEPIELTGRPTIDLQESPPGPLIFAKAHMGILLMTLIALFGVSLAGVYVVRGNRVILSLVQMEEAQAKGRKIELSRRKIKKKQLTLGPSTSDDISIDHPSLKDFHCILSFVRVGGNTHAYLRRSSNLPIVVNGKPQYNAQLKDHDKIRLGDILFEVHAASN